MYKQIASGKLLYSTELSLVLCDDPEGWHEGRGERFKRKVMYVCTHS